MDKHSYAVFKQPGVIKNALTSARTPLYHAQNHSKNRSQDAEPATLECGLDS